MKPKLLDLFCGAGGACRGYQDAGWDVTGVDTIPQPRYPGRFVQCDALDYLIRFAHEFDAYHASPPCQRYSVATRVHGTQHLHVDLVGPVRDLLLETDRPFIIENVVGAPLRDPVMLCGTMFDLRVFRHRLFESNVILTVPAHPRHNGSTGAHRGYSTLRSGRNGYVCVAGHNFHPATGARAMGIDWMGNRYELAQAIPPAYTAYLGAQLLGAIS